LVLGLTVDNDGWKTKKLAPETFTQSVRAEETNRYSVVARKLIDLLNTGDYAAVQKLFNPEMSKALPPQKASEFFTGLAAQFGNIEKFDGPIGSSDGWIGFRLHGQRGELTMSLVLDADDRIAGVIFRPAPRSSANSEPPVRRLFSWPHLVWIVPFFLGGLLFSWILQRGTEESRGDQHSWGSLV